MAQLADRQGFHLSVQGAVPRMWLGDAWKTQSFGNMGPWAGKNLKGMWLGKRRDVSWLNEISWRI